MNRPYTSRRQRGFSLLELLAVMAIIATLTTLAVTSYFSAVRGMARRSAVKNLANTLILARQRACIESACFSVIMFNEVKGTDDKEVTPSYVVCKEVGKITKKSNNKSGEDILVDEFTPLNTLFSTDKDRMGENGVMRLYNLSEGKWSLVKQYVESHNLDFESVYNTYNNKNNTSYAFTVSKESNPNAATWEIGDSYGIEATSVRSLNRHFFFTKLGKNNSGVLKVTFAPDGQLKKPKDGEPDNDTKIELVEQRGEGDGNQKSSEIKIKAESGKIIYDGIWK